MLPRDHQYPLRRDKDFFSTATRLTSPLFTAWIKKSAGVFQAKVIVSKKVARLASARNKLKRSTNQILASLANKYPQQILVLALKPQVINLLPAQLHQEITRVLEKNSLQNNNNS